MRKNDLEQLGSPDNRDINHLSSARATRTRRIPPARKSGFTWVIRNQDLAQEIGKKRGKAHVNVGEIAREAGEKEVDVGCRRNRPKEAVLCGHRT